MSEPLERFRRGGPVTPDPAQDGDDLDRARAHRRATWWTLLGGGAVLALAVTILLAVPDGELDDLGGEAPTEQAGPVQLNREQATEACLRDVADELARLRAVTRADREGDGDDDGGETGGATGRPLTPTAVPPLEVLLAHPRDGDYVLVVVDGESISQCELQGRAVDVTTYLTSSYVTEPPADGFYFDQSWVYGSQPDRRTVVAGRVGEDVVSVTMVLLDGTEVPAPMLEGVFATTWTTARGESQSPLFVATLEDGSTTERRFDRP